MIDLYTWSTPNGRKVSIALEELGLKYRSHSVDIGQNEQFSPDFLAISPNNKIPVIVDHDSSTHLMESGAILLYLAQKTGQLISSKPDLYWQTIAWLMWQMSGQGPMLGQVHHFVKFNPGSSEYAERRYLTEAKRLYSLLNDRLSSREFVADDYSIADIAIWPWVARFQWQTIELNKYPSVKRWYCTIANRPAVQRGYVVPDKTALIPIP